MPRQDWQHLYKSKRWRKLRADQLKAHPLCQCPHCGEGRKRPTEANVVDHIIPHKGDRKLFFDKGNLQSMGKTCHDRHKQSQERGGAGFLSGCDERGWPLSDEHDWHERT